MAGNSSAHSTSASSTLKEKRNAAADGLSRTIFPDDCSSDDVTRQLLQEAEKHDEDGKREWFWKSGKGDYEEMLKNLTKDQEVSETQCKPRMIVALAGITNAIRTFHHAGTDIGRSRCESAKQAGQASP